MSVTRIITDLAEARETVLKRKPLGSEEMPAPVAARIQEVFGAALTPSEVVDRILADVQAEGDAALGRYLKHFDGVAPKPLEVSREEIEAALSEVDDTLLDVLRQAEERIAAYHERQRRNSWMDFGTGLGEMIRPLQRVGIYSPGTERVYPSSVLMSVVPARVAGVDEIILATPCRADGSVHLLKLAAAAVAGVHRVFKISGAQAVAALAFGTAQVPRVDKILGPGNIFVVLAKQKVFGLVGIDQLPGPTETLIVADAHADPAEVAADMLAQAEHDFLATPLLLTDSVDLANRVENELAAQLAALPRQEEAAYSLKHNGGIVVVADLETAIHEASEYAPEHLCLLTQEPWQWVGRVRNAGGIFVGSASPEVLGDYMAGPSHIMPVGGTARFSSPLTVQEFYKSTSIVALDPESAAAIAEPAAALAEAEGFYAHAAAARRRARQD
ncbi:MAG: histidinol dehydrogenase [Chloroflexota bacterium]|nr:histidinol dehydrogenase [Chloroflexota bacterium]MDE2839353.1 histidinol dehydrogenase [Chloroflexota bacterium]MDE2931837.1 histidinol dehydrogenase [Chloroflexota bacterium]